MAQVLIGGSMSIPVWDDSVDNTTGGLPTAKGFTVQPPVAGEQMEVVSTSIMDDLTSTGAQKVKVVYLDSSWALLTEEIDTNGTAAVSTTDLDIARIIQFFVSQAGSGDENSGNITLRTQGGGGNDYATIPAAMNTWAPGRFTVPAGKTASVRGGTFTTGDAGNNDIATRIYAEMDLDTGIYVADLFNLIGVCHYRRMGVINIPSGILVPAQSTIFVKSEASVTGPLTVSGQLQIDLYN